MFMHYLLLAFGLLVSGVTFALPHLDLEMSSEEYRHHLKHLSKNKTLAADDPAITASLKLGERLSKWIAKINGSRPADAGIRLTSPQTRRGIPIDAPSIYSPSIIKTGAQKILSELPEAMKFVITSDIELPTSTGLDDETFIKHARLLDRNYQSAARYKSVNAYRGEYEAAASEDVRGYFYLKQNNISAESLKDVAGIPADQVAPIKAALTKICFNKERDYENCENKLEKAFKSNTLGAFFTKYFSTAQKIWNNFFVIPANAVRSDVNWSGTVMTVPFNTPSIAKFVPYLQVNIEDEFRFADWALKMNFGTFGDGPRLVFQPGVVPHVNGLGGNQIVMDSNQPIEEYESQWTIRHEFGHVLGLPDCYHEFYDTNLEAYVNYQLDISDLMCSRAGNMKERIYTELKKAYGK
jgi:hypothetical protein